MTKFYTFFTALALISITFTSCTKDKKGYLPLEMVNFYPFEELTPEGRNLRLVFYTEKEYPCINHIIRYTNSSTASNFDITLVDVESQTLCLDETGPAKAVIDFGNLASGTYPLTIMVADSFNTGTIEISTEKYVLSIQNPQMLEIKYDTLLRIPDFTVWGVIAFSDSTGFPVMEMFLDTLEARGAVPDTLNFGNFGYFKTDSTGEILITDNGGWIYAEPFVYHYTEDWNEIGEIVQYFAFTYPGDIFVYIYNYQGQAYLTSYFY
jgi:hypothetical protein